MPTGDWRPTQQGREGEVVGVMKTIAIRVPRVIREGIANLCTFACDYNARLSSHFVVAELHLERARYLFRLREGIIKQRRPTLHTQPPIVDLGEVGLSHLAERNTQLACQI